MLGLPFTVCPANVDETVDPTLSPAETAAAISRKKAFAVSALPDAVVVAADTVVTVDGAILGKPTDPEDAVRMLRLLSGRTHSVYTGFTVLNGETAVTESVRTDVRFRPISEEEIRAYVATGEPMDKAGAYGIQGRASIFAEALCGDYYNVMGLPLCRLCEVLKDFGAAVFGTAAAR